MVYPLGTMFKAIFIKTSLVFLGFFCFSILSTAQSPSTQTINQSGDVTPSAAPTKPAQTAPVTASSDNSINAQAPAQPVMQAKSSDLTVNPNSAGQNISGDASKPGQIGMGVPLKPGLPVQHLMPNQVEENLKLSLISRLGGFDLRKLKAINWPPVDIIKHKDSEYADLDTIKDPKQLKKRLYDRCVDYVQAYENYVKEQFGGTSIGAQFSIQCDIYATVLEGAPYSAVDPLFDIPNEALTRRLDQATFSLYMANTSGGLRRSAALESYLKSYEASLFGLIGVPIQFSFLIMQIMMVLLLGISGFLLYKKIRE